MSAVQHRAAAEILEKESQEHAHRTDPGSGTVCGVSATQGSSPCWSTPSNQLAHQEEARRLHDLAERHRAAGNALVQAELAACAGLNDVDREESPLFHRDDITSVSSLGRSNADGPRSGAVIRFRAVEGLTVEWLERAARCHIARAAAIGHPAELGYCPLAVRGANAAVSATSSGFQMEVWAPDAASSAEILRRAQGLGPK